ncbi:hypothetical protein SEA_FEDE_19 [Microbacterium phage Fede]|nr:hypothetical protein SEA_FEDE_19 [Microbacterium phage Fede]
MSTLLDPCPDNTIFDINVGITQDCYVVHDDEVIVYWHGKSYTHHRSEYATPPQEVEGKVCDDSYASGPCTAVQFGYEVRIDNELPPTGLDMAPLVGLGLAALVAVTVGIVLLRRRKNS